MDLAVNWSFACRWSSILGTLELSWTITYPPICHPNLSVFPKETQFSALSSFQHSVSGLVQVTSNFFSLLQPLLQDLPDFSYQISYLPSSLQILLNFSMYNIPCKMLKKNQLLCLCLLRNSRSFKKNQNCTTTVQRFLKTWYIAIILSRGTRDKGDVTEPSRTGAE